jgi:prepilin-type N-terminal cleavage/methylation domain-containing protein
LPGFSLIEMLIVVTLFSITVLIMAETFASFNQLHRKIANRAVVSEDIRFAMEMLVRATRSHAISYATVPLARESELRLETPNGPRMIFRLSAAGDPVCADLPTVACLLLSTDSGVTWAPVSGKRINVERFDVYVRPLASPFDLVGSAYPNDTQPFVTFDIKETYLADRALDNETIETQSTVSSRVYQR